MTNPFVFCIEEADIRLNVTQLRPEMVLYEPIADLTNEKTNKQTNKQKKGENKILQLENHLN